MGDFPQLQNNDNVPPLFCLSYETLLLVPGALGSLIFRRTIFNFSLRYKYIYHVCMFEIGANLLERAQWPRNL